MSEKLKIKKSARKLLFYILCLVIFLTQGCRSTLAATPTQEQRSPIPPTSTQDQPDLVLATSTAEIIKPTTTPTFVIPVGFKEYQDGELNISVSIPETWVITGVIEGQYAIFQSYPEDKYIGGEGLDPGDTKCDLNIRPVGESVSALILQWKSAPMTTIISEGEIILQSGQPGIRIELDSMGRSNSIITEINKRVIVVTCFGDFARFDEIADTIRTCE